MAIRDFRSPTVPVIRCPKCGFPIVFDRSSLGYCGGCDSTAMIVDSPKPGKVVLSLKKGK